MKLYEIDYKIREFWDKVIEQDGELTEEDIQTLESLEVAKDEKEVLEELVVEEMKYAIKLALPLDVAYGFGTNWMEIK